MLFFLAACLFVVSLNSCEGDSPVVVGENPYEPLGLTSEQEIMVNTGNQFALKLLAAVDAEAEGNYIISPLGLQFTLGMLLEGANGQTAQEICEVLGFRKDNVASVNEFYGRLIRELPTLDKLTDIISCRTVLTAPTLNLKEDYVSSVSESYQAHFEQVDFSKTAAARNVINNWCSKNTNGMIREMVSEKEESYLKSVRAMFLDALWFKGLWMDKFNKKASGKDIFTREDGTKETVVYMKKTADFNASILGTHGSVSIPYGNGAYSMVVCLPNEGESTQDAIQRMIETGYIPQLGYPGNPTELWLPRFELEYEANYERVLDKMGMPAAFSALADFSKMSDEGLTIDRLRQKSAIKIDEDGTEAAAVTQAVMLATGAPSILQLYVNRPFLFFVTEKSTGAILFSGAYKGIYV